MRSTEYQGILFFEDVPAGATLLEKIDTQIGGVFRSAQMASLNDIKGLMAAEARSKGGNAIVGFTYGQRSSGFWASIVSRDDVRWYGSGRVAKIEKS